MKMKSFIFAIITMALFLMAACTADNDRPTAHQTIKINATIGSNLQTRTTPLGTPEEQAGFVQEDIIEVIKYNRQAAGTSIQYQFNGTSWESINGSGHIHSSDAEYFRAFYPVVNGNTYDKALLPTDQNTEESIRNADFMRAEGNNYADEDNTLSLSFNRKRALVRIKIAGYGNELDPVTDKITDLTVYSPTAGFSSEPDNAETNQPVAIKPYVEDASGQHQTSTGNGNIGYRYSALISPVAPQPSDAPFKFIELTLQHGTEAKTMSVMLDKYPWGEGFIYEFELIIGNDAVKIAKATVNEWKSSGIQHGGNAHEGVLDVTGMTADDVTDNLLKEYCIDSRLTLKGAFGTNSDKYNSDGVLAFAKVAKFVRTNPVKYIDFSQTTGISSLSKKATYLDSEGKEQTINLSFMPGVSSPLEEVHLPTTVTNIYWAFYNCENLKKVTGTEQIEPGADGSNVEGAFSSCNLDEIPNMPKVNILNGLFYGTKFNFTTFESNYFTEIKDFSQYNNITIIKLPNAATLHNQCLEISRYIQELHLTAKAFEEVDNEPFSFLRDAAAILYLNALQESRITTDGTSSCIWKPVDNSATTVSLAKFTKVICGDKTVYNRE